jgi:hypothetical protein
MKLIIKGTAEQAMEAAHKRKLDLQIVSTADDHTAARLAQKATSRVIKVVERWFAESDHEAPPYAPGSLLWWGDTDEESE